MPLTELALRSAAHNHPDPAELARRRPPFLTLHPEQIRERHVAVAERDARPHAEGFYARMGMRRVNEITHDGEPMVWMTLRLHRAT